MYVVRPVCLFRFFMEWNLKRYSACRQLYYYDENINHETFSAVGKSVITFINITKITFKWHIVFFLNMGTTIVGCFLGQTWYLIDKRRPTTVLLTDWNGFICYHSVRHNIQRYTRGKVYINYNSVYNYTLYIIIHYVMFSIVKIENEYTCILTYVKRFLCCIGHNFIVKTKIIKQNIFFGKPWYKPKNHIHEWHLKNSFYFHLQV